MYRTYGTAGGDGRRNIDKEEKQSGVLERMCGKNGWRNWVDEVGRMSQS